MADEEAPQYSYNITLFETTLETVDSDIDAAANASGYKSEEQTMRRINMSVKAAKDLMTAHTVPDGSEPFKFRVDFSGNYGEGYPDQDNLVVHVSLLKS